MQGALLMYHSAEDQNTGTDPDQLGFACSTR